LGSLRKTRKSLWKFDAVRPRIELKGKIEKLGECQENLGKMSENLEDIEKLLM
jgi:hypothetical protein